MARLADALSAAAASGLDHRPPGGRAAGAADAAVLPATVGLGGARRAASAEASSFLGNLAQPPPENDDDRPGEMTWSIPWSGEWTTMQDLHNTIPSVTHQYMKYICLTAGITFGGFGTFVPAFLAIKFNESLAKMRAERAAPILQNPDAPAPVPAAPAAGGAAAAR
mmetsp:Transcript_8859/g.17787  ORF Transcript_8859/g.17787 Transcript_8859/m.17787 type:complete len:166 (-) Transcript_8859:102-599(-)